MTRDLQQGRKPKSNRRRSLWRRRNEIFVRKDGFMELHMSGDKNSFGRWFKTEVGTLGLRVAKKDAGF